MTIKKLAGLGFSAFTIVAMIVIGLLSLFLNNATTTIPGLNIGFFILTIFMAISAIANGTLNLIGVIKDENSKKCIGYTVTIIGVVGFLMLINPVPSYAFEVAKSDGEIGDIIIKNSIYLGISAFGLAFIGFSFRKRFGGDSKFVVPLFISGIIVFIVGITIFSIQFFNSAFIVVSYVLGLLIILSGSGFLFVDKIFG